eukprot:GFUD01100441.1.p1 GENE.GFUD01100441.1~~GFUD01100441.1.p1  ORF type:complete len:327 (+),score=78.61 GFUD01100441.1:40-1020(+)
MSGSEHFCLRWNDFEANISQAFQAIREEKDFFDVTIACEDEQVQAHKVILSACSPFFKKVLKKNPHQHPLLFLKGVKYAEIVSILNFMYHGEVNVTQDDLNGFLAVAEELKVKGLTQNDQNNAGERSKPQPKPSREPPDIKITPPLKRPRVSTLPRNDDIQEIVTPVPVKTEPVSELVSHSIAAGFTNDDHASFANTLVAEPQEEDYDQGYDYVEYEEENTSHFEPSQASLNTARPADGNKEMVTYVMSQLEEGVDPNGKKMYTCKLCNFSNVKKEKVRQHVESWHGDAIGIRYKCDYCEKTYKCHSNLRTHVSTNHRQNFISTWT